MSARLEDVERMGQTPTINHFFLLASIVTLVRLVVLLFSKVDLGPDETQYWFWAQSPDWGYFSKPPMIAWTIAATTTVFGNTEWAVRLAAPFFHLGAAVFLFFTARRLYGDNAGFWAGALWLTAPGVALSSTVIATDAPLLLFWSMGLFAFFELSTAPHERKGNFALSTLLGAAIGFGLLSKYAMMYFAPAALAALLFTQIRISLREGLVAALVSIVIFLPNGVWNAQNGFQTVSHTAANANWSGTLFHPVALFEFLGAQFGVIGPVALALALFAAIETMRNWISRRDIDWRDAALLWFAAPPLLIVSAQAFISRAHANWAAAAYPAAIVLIAGWAMRRRQQNWLKLALAINLVVIAALSLVVVNLSIADRLGFSDAVKRVRGWEAQGAVIAAMTEGYDAVMADDREIIGGIVYYARDRSAPIAAWNSNRKIEHHFEAFHPFKPGAYKRVLYVTPHADAIALTGQFDTIALVREVAAPLDAAGERRLYLFEASGYRGLRDDL